MSTFTAVELSKLPVPDLTEQVSFEQSYADLKATLYLLAPEYATLLESDPMSVLLQVCAYREVHLRESFNVRGKGNMLAYAGGGDLDNLGAFFGVVRQQITPAHPKTNTPAVMESDVELRRRIQLAPEGYSVAGPEGAYLFHALSADPDVLDVSAMSPTPGEVLVTLLSRSGDGIPSSGLVERVAAALMDGNVRPLTDLVTVRAAEIMRYTVKAEIVTYAGPDAAVVLEEANRRLRAYVDESHRLGRDVPRSGLYASLHVEGVQRVNLIEPVDDLFIANHQAAHCTAFDIVHVGNHE
ncbi:TPA: baseplate J/gp47 family protein [Stenotrophomonas maltophilia]|nr:baseplate J/gp47 family protein [Stenotrophomonas maltophilia]HDX0814881.1 baseplate J/gp47 family protein [Stenotrophomonas maltophilia]HDX0825870.1 baseplate J/gp47 family protein [Stenotrophomonas maltophilia]HDX0841989.1 baseplate J/gp47 family protein [Stenotrophomonas maltophilia]HDX0851547.1 baseplate J/gp47 family protein [Stenotrophomonas maltophilia]